MCFYNDYDWHADVWEETECALDRSRCCHECGERMLPGDWHRYIWMQEREDCILCEEGGCEGRHDFGNTFEYVRCRTCDLILLAIHDVEAEANCPLDARQPALGELGEAIRYADDREKYAVKAAEFGVYDHSFFQVAE